MKAHEMGIVCSRPMLLKVSGLLRNTDLGKLADPAFRADRDQMESADRVKMLAKQTHRADCVSPCKRNSL